MSRTTGGCRTPTSLIDADNSAKASVSKIVLGCFGFGTIAFISTSPWSAIVTPVVVVIGSLNEVGINESRPRPNPPLRVLMQYALHYSNCLLDLKLRQNHVGQSLAQLSCKQRRPEMMRHMSLLFD